MSKLVDIYKRRVTDKLTINFYPSSRDKVMTRTLLISEADSKPSIALKRFKQTYETKSVQHLASHEPKGIASLKLYSLVKRAKFLASHEALQSFSKSYF